MKYVLLCSLLISSGAFAAKLQGNLVAAKVEAVSKYSAQRYAPLVSYFGGAAKFEALSNKSDIAAVFDKYGLKAVQDRWNVYGIANKNVIAQ